MGYKLIHSLRKLLRPLLAAATIIVAINAEAQTAESVDSLNALLAEATTPEDSVALLHNLYDCLYFDRKPILKQIFETAERAGDYTSMLEVVFVLTASYQHEPEIEEELLELVDRVPESEAQRLQKLYVKLRFEMSKIQRMTEEERQQRLHEALMKYREEGNLDKFDRITHLFVICTNLRSTTYSQLLIYYLNELQSMIDEFPVDELPIRSLFYSLASSSFLNNNLFQQAIEANRRILGLVGQFDKLHESQGRIFRNYDGSLYDCYHNMLMCYEVLTDEEIEDCYNHILQIIDRNPRIKKNIERQNRSRIFYLMAKKRYAEAIPILRYQLEATSDFNGYKNMADALVKAARETGDKESLLYGTALINKLYKERQKAKSDISLNELLTIYDVENLKGQNKDLIIENQRIEIHNRQQTVIAAVVALLVVICLLVWMVSLYLHSRWLAKRLSDSNKKLIEERNTLKETYAKLVNVRDKAKAADRIKSDFVENMSEEIRVPLGAIVEYSHLIADFAEEDERPYIREYADIMTINTDLMIRLVNDLLDLPQLENGELSIHRSPSSLNGICNFALKFVKKHVGPGVDIIFANAGQPDYMILTDPQRVEQVLIQLLTNAAKFTENGSITFGYEISQKRDKVTFTVTDTGIGVPKGMEEAIFNRFVKIDPTTQGNGLGLYIGRLMAKMLGGSLKLDSKYRTGARFIFTVPIL